MNKILRLLTITAASLGAVLGTTSCDNGNHEDPGQHEDAVTLSLNKTSVTIVIGQTDTLVATATGAAEGTVVSFASDHEDIATVDATGKITAVAKGSATITVTYGDKTAICAVSVIKFVDNFILSAVDENANIKNFKNSVADLDDEFIGETSPVIEVGDDNPFVMTPKITIFNKQTMDEADPSIWDYDYEYKIQVLSGSEYVDTTDDVADFDAKKCTFDFKENAIGKDFKLMVRPGGLTEDQKAKPDFAFKEALVHVSNGYNVYNANDLAYFNDINFADDFRQDGHADGLNAAWVKFRAEKGLDATYVAPSIFLQSDLALTNSNLPSDFFFKAGDEVGDPSWVGKMKDSTDVYAHYANDFTFNGNYFNINTEAVSVSAPSWDNNDHVSHSSLFKVAYNGTNDGSTKDLVFKNCSYHGNAAFNDKSDGSFGLLFFKIRNTISGVNDIDNTVLVHATFDNFNVSQACISFYGEYGPNKLTIKDSVIKNGYSNGVYFYHNGTAEIINCKLSKFGGPAFLTFPDKNATIKSVDVIIDDKTVVDNWLTGGEPWFLSTMDGMPATFVPQIQQLDGVVNGMSGDFGTARSYLKGEDMLMNMIFLSIGDSYYTTLKVGNNSQIGYNTETDPTLNATINAMASAGAFIFTPDGGGCAYFDGAPHLMDGSTNFAGNYLQLMGGNLPFGFISIFFELVDFVPPAE